MTKQELINNIKTAFKGVKLEDGIGLKAGNAIDDYATSEEFEKAQQEDEKDNWETIPFEDICNYESAFSFTDAKGMRFLMPQYMIADLLGKELNFEPLWKLEQLNDGSKQFELFNIEQIRVVIHFIEYVLERDSDGYDYEMNKRCGVNDDYNKLLQQEHIDKIQNTKVLLEWREFLNEKQLELEEQLTCPNGEMGIKIGHMMNKSNIGMTLNSIAFLDINDNDRVLELGHGNCGHLDKVLGAGHNVRYCGLEISETMFDEAKQQESDWAEFQLYDGEHIPYEDEYFDKVFTVNTIYFWKNPIEMLKEIQRILKFNGVCVLAYANKDFMKKLVFVGDKFELYDQERITNLIAQSSLKLVDTKELSEQVKSKTGELVNRTYTMVKIRK